MNLLWWALFAVLCALTVLWVLLIRADARHYLESQVKVLGEKNIKHIRNPHVRLLFKVYAAILVFLILGFGIYLSSL